MYKEKVPIPFDPSMKIMCTIKCLKCEEEFVISLFEYNRNIMCECLGCDHEALAKDFDLIKKEKYNEQSI